MDTAPRPRLAVWKFASCDGCQLSLLDCEDELLALTNIVEIAHFTEVTPKSLDGDFDLSLVEGSITTAHDQDRIKTIRQRSKVLMTIGACATAGGVQALRNGRDIQDFLSVVYPSLEYIDTLPNSTPIADHVSVDYELRGCPIDKGQLLTAITALLHGRRPPQESGAVCLECKARGNPCITVTDGAACLGPVTRAGCGAICPAYARGCYGCFGPVANANTAAFTAQLKALGMSKAEIARAFQTFNAAAPAFDKAACDHGA